MPSVAPRCRRAPPFRGARCHAGAGREPFRQNVATTLGHPPTGMLLSALLAPISPPA